MNRILLFIAFISIPFISYSQANCSNPVHLTLCPSTTLTNQTNAGMIDDSPIPCNIAGEDLVYEIYAPNNALHIYVSLINATGPCKLTLKTTTCNNTGCYTRNANAGNSNFTFTVNPSHYYYLWVDAASTINYDISIGGDTSSQVIYIPNTMGNLNFDWCAPNPFYSPKPFFEVEYNGIYKTKPMTLAPLNVPGLMCITFYMMNQTGVSGPKKFEFAFNPGGFSNVSSVSSIVPGFYNSGNWIAGPSTTIFPFTFNDSAGIGRGDFTGSPNSCLRYSFCFNVTPLNNDPALTNVTISITSDTYGAGYYSNTRSGCCSSGLPNCLGSPGGPLGNASTIGFGFDDPGGALPVTLTGFNARLINDQVLLEWSTASEINCDYFTIERSDDNLEFEEIQKIKGSGNSTVTEYYSTIDKNPLPRITYYRLTQTDFDGEKTIYKSVRINNPLNDISVYPNPASKFLNIEGDFKHIKLFNQLGKSVLESENNPIIRIDNFPDGIYLMQIETAGGIISEKIIIQQ